MKPTQKKLIAVAVSSLVAATASAQQTETPKRVEAITITGSAIDDRFGDGSREPSSVVNLSGRNIEGQHVDNLLQALRAIPGMTVDSAGGDDIKIKFRGIENQRYMGEKPGVAIVIDGVPVFERTGRVNIDLDNIETIKIIKGGASYLFGDDGLSGAVVITTKRGAKYKGVNFEADQGAHGYERYLARAGFATERLSGHVQFTRRGADDYHFQSNYSMDALTGNMRWNINSHSDLTLGFEKEDRFRDKHGTVTGVTAAEKDPTGTQGRDFSRHYDVGLERINATYSNDLSEHTNLLALAYQFKDATKFWSSPQRFSATGAAVTASDAYTTLNDYDQTQRGAKGEFRTSFGNTAFMVGGEFRRNEYLNLTSALTSFRNSPAGATTTAGTIFGDDVTKEGVEAIYGEAKWSPVRDWTFTGNLRFDHIKLDYAAKPVSGNGNVALNESKSFSSTSFRVGANWTIASGTYAFGNVSSGFRAPNVDQLYRGSISPTSSVANNPDLKPEQAINYELGARHRFKLMGQDAHVHGTVFLINRKDFILDSSGQYGNSNSTNIGRFENIGGARSRGVELSLGGALSKSVVWEMAYTYLDAYFTRYDKYNLSLGNPRGVLVGTGSCKTTINWNNCYQLVPYNNTGNAVPRTSPHSLNLRATWKAHETLKISPEIDYRSTSWADEVSINKWPGRTLFNLTADYSRKVSWLKGATLSAFVRVDNVFAKRYYSIARGANDSQSYATNFQYDGKYNAEDMSITVDPGRVWRAGISLKF